ncbi:MAG TPA: hypothetical protein VF789_11630 [Thermoanaerobaculia bacterium]
MSMPVLSYSPSHTEIPILESLTTGESRHRLIETLVDAVRSEIGRESHQHQLLIGPRGSGKTHTLTLVAHRLRTDPELQSAVLPVVLAEEEVASYPADLMRKVLGKLASILETAPDLKGRDAALRESRNALAALRSEKDDERALDIVIGALESASAALNRLLVVVIENLNSLLYAGPGLSRRATLQGQWGFRRALLESRGLLLLGAAPSLFGEVTQSEAPFYDFFRLHRLGELPPEEMLALIRSRLDLELRKETLDSTRKSRLQTLSDHFDERVPKLRGLLVLTGGLPRFAHLIFDLLAETDVSSVAGTISRFLDEQTPYFQSRLDPRLIPEAELEILDILASSSAPLTPKEIASELRGGVPNAVATFLKRLRDRGLVRPVGNSRKDTRYDLTEPLFRVWRRFRLGRTEREQILVLAEFVAAMFEKGELETELQLLEGLEVSNLRRNVVQSALGLLDKLSPLYASSPFQELIEEAERAFREGNASRALKIFEAALQQISEADPRRKLEILNRMAPVAFSAGMVERALNAIEEAESIARSLDYPLGLAETLLNRGFAYLNLLDYQQALEATRAAERTFQKIGNKQGYATALLNSAWAVFQLGDSQQALQLIQKSEQTFQRLNDLNQVFHCRLLYGQITLKAGRWEEYIEHQIRSYQLMGETANNLIRTQSIQTLWGNLSKLASQADPDRFRRLVRLTEPLLQSVRPEEFMLVYVIRFGADLLRTSGPELLLDVLPILEAGLPEEYSIALHPLRLAAEIQTGKMPKELPEESEEMRRVVREVFEYLKKAPSDTSSVPAPTKGQPKKARKRKT